MSLEALTSLPLAKGEPAGGAELGQIIIANVFAVAGCALLAWLVLGHRSGKLPYLERAGAAAEKATGLPAWSPRSR